eukprot:g36357.t1
MLFYFSLRKSRYPFHTCFEDLNFSQEKGTDISKKRNQDVFLASLIVFQENPACQEKHYAQAVPVAPDFSHLTTRTRKRLTPKQKVLRSHLLEDPDSLRTVIADLPAAKRLELMRPFLKHLEASTIASLAHASQAKDGVLTVEELHNWFQQRYRQRISVISKVQMKLEAEDPPPLQRTSSQEVVADDLRQLASEEMLARGLAEELDQEEDLPPATREQLWKLAVVSGLPFVGFGFLDNFIMIVAGVQIDNHFSALGVSSMAAAALGNTVSDIAGIQAGGMISALAARMGLPDPKLEPHQLTSTSVRLVTMASSMTGITIGCLLGMVPLLF